MNQPITVQPVPNFYDTRDKLERLLLKLNSVEGYKLLCDLQYAYQDLDQAHADECKTASQLQAERDEYETKLDDIAATLDAMHSGFRDFSDLARTIQA